MRNNGYAKCLIVIVTAVFAVSAMIVLAANQGRASTEQSELVAAVAPVYPVMAAVSNTGGEVTVEVEVSPNGKVASARAVEGHDLLRQAAENAARRWRFKSAQNTTTVRLAFVFRIMPRETPMDDLAPTFMPPYQVEVRHHQFEPVVHSDPAGRTVRSRRQEKKRAR